MEYKVIVNKNSSEEEWYYNGKLHRENGPAFIAHNGNKYWYQHGQLHREDGPAIECPDGAKFWYRNNQLHREDGPAYDVPPQNKQYYLNGTFYSEQAWKQALKELQKEKANYHNKIVEIEGKKYQLKIMK